MFGKGSSISLCGNSNNKVLRLAQKANAETILNTKALLKIIQNNQSFPPKHRVIVWRYILQIPMNENAYMTLAQQPIHSSICSFPQQLPIRFGSISKRFMRTLSCLAYWHPPLAECDWLPSLVFPFLMLFGRDSIIVFEVIATVIYNWCQEWISFVPNPPVKILSRISRICHDFGETVSPTLIWPVLRSFFGEVSTTDSALILLDNILSSRPSFIEYLISSYFILHVDLVTETNVYSIIKKAKQIYKKDIINNPDTSEFKPLPKDFYPVLIVVKKSKRWKEKELERIRLEAETRKRQTEIKKEVKKETEQIEKQRRNWLNQRLFLSDIETEQIEEFIRKETEENKKLNFGERKDINERKKQIEKRKIDQISEIDNWRKEYKKINEDVDKLVKSHQETWNEWLNLKEEEAEIANQEIDNEINLIDEIQKTSEKEKSNYNENVRNINEIENDLLDRITHRTQELENAIIDHRQFLEEKRRENQLFS